MNNDDNDIPNAHEAKKLSLDAAKANEDENLNRLREEIKKEIMFSIKNGLTKTRIKLYLYNIRLSQRIAIMKELEEKQYEVEFKDKNSMLIKW